MISKKLADLAEINQKNFSKLKTKIRGKEDEMDALFMKNASEIQFGYFNSHIFYRLVSFFYFL